MSDVETTVAFNPAAASAFVTADLRPYIAELRAIASFFSKVAPANDGSGCLLWTASVTKDGYGIFNLPRQNMPDGPARTVRAHRWAYEQHHGVMLSPEDRILHSCDTPACVQVEHLRAGTPAENSADMIRRGRQASGERVPSAVLTAQQVAEIRERYAASRVVQTTLAAEYGVSQQTISAVIRGRNWRWEPVTGGTEYK